MWKIALALIVAAAWTADAGAQDQPLQQVRIDRPAAWVKPVGAIKTDIPDDGAAVHYLLLDGQVHFGPEGVTHYTETMTRVQTPQGLQTMSTLTLSWDPALGSLTVHKFQILRAGQTIDVLAAQKFTVLRREKNLEAQQLNGVLSAVLQPEDLRVGDVVDLAYSVTTKDPALGGHIQWVSTAPNVAIDDLRLQATGDQAIFWRATDGFDNLKPRVTDQGKSLSVMMKNVQPLLFPNGAPMRFRWGRMVQFGDFRSWADVSAVMAPLYAKASTIAADSPLQAEIARIKSAYPDPKARAQAALDLVQDNVRYIELAMNDGGYVPADASLTWKRRFGDCKGKTVLLLALLHGMGIDAQPVLVNTKTGDGLDERLPLPGAFDHVLVRAIIGGRTYWLDGTRLGDRRLDDITTPNMSWALPVQAANATLVRLVVPPLDKAATQIELRLDASKGIDVPAAVHAEAVFRGDVGWALNGALSNLSPAQREEAERTFWTKANAILAPATVSARFDPLSREERLVMDGTASMSWDAGANNARVFFVRDAPVGPKPDFIRQPGPQADAPFAVPYPGFTDLRETIVLPYKGQGFRLQGTDIEQRVAGRLFSRKVKLEKGVFTVEVVNQSLAPEFPAAEAATATEALQDMAKAALSVGAPANYRMTSADLIYYGKKSLSTPRDLMQRGEAMRAHGLLALARADMERAIALDPKQAPQFANIVQVYAAQGDFTAAHDALKKGFALNPDGVGLMRAAGLLAMTEARFDDAVTEFGKLLAKQPSDRFGLRNRAVAYENLNKLDLAVADADALLKVNAKDADARQLKVFLLVQAAKGDAALTEADAGIALEPKSAPAHIVKGDALRVLRRDADAQAQYDLALGLDQSAGGHLERASRRMVGDHTNRLKDVEEALKLDPDNEQALAERAGEEALTGRLDKALADANDLVAKNPDEVVPRRTRALIYTRNGKLDLAEADVDWMRAHVEQTAAAWNTLCYDQGVWNLSLEKALADCDKGLSLASHNAAILDSRAFILLRLGRADDAVAAYDQALRLAPHQPDSLYGRGLARASKGLGSEAKADFAAARALRPHVDEAFAEYGLKPPAIYASSNSATK